MTAEKTGAAGRHGLMAVSPMAKTGLERPPLPLWVAEQIGAERAASQVAQAASTPR